ncbi:MAG: hypothetical protein Q4A05_05205 [Ruminococcus sp.]|nr:hypothetical protein [Ruminococcus sp.]
MKRLIIVEGLPCSGKSTTARYIAEKLGMRFVDEGTGDHPADYEFQAFLTESDLEAFTADERELVLQNSAKKSGGYISELGAFSGELFDKLLQYKVYDFLPWETERPVMLDKWREFAQNIRGESYVFNCVLLQNPMCETMMRFGFDEAVSEAYIREICGMIEPLSPFVVYLGNSEVYDSVKKASAERGDDWLNAVIDYHCGGEYGKKLGLSGFDGYIAALEERQRRELSILGRLGVDNIVLDDPQRDWESAYSAIISELNEVR